jgi:hypothetical protein
MSFFRFRMFIAKWTNYEYWPWLVFFLPMVPVHLYYALKSRYFYYLTAANPGIDLGGLFGESKIEILNHFSDEYKPKTHLHHQGELPSTTIEEIKKRGFEPPFILKPNIGERGDQVVKTDSLSTIEQIIESKPLDYIIQEFIDYPLEFGVLYGRLPGADRGSVRSVVMKGFLTVTGDGSSTVEQLLLLNKRAWFQMERFKKEKSDLMNLVLTKGETKVIEHIGNHCKGTEFINANHLINENLNRVFDSISKQFEGFYYGRFDLKARSIEEFAEGKTIKIFELNGVTSEAGHIYDKNYSLFQAYRDVAREMGFVYQISKLNINSGIKPLSAVFMTKLILSHFRNKNS